MDVNFVQELENLFFKGFAEDTFDILGKKWKMRTLNETEATWRDQFLVLSASPQMLSSKRVPTLAIAIREIDGKLVEELFYSPDADQPTDFNDMIAKRLTKNIIYDNPQYLAAENFRVWLGSMPGVVIDALYYNYNTLDQKAKEALVKATTEVGNKEFFRGDREAQSTVSSETNGHDKNEPVADRGTGTKDVGATMGDNAKSLIV